MNKHTDPNDPTVQTIENATRDDIRPGDHITRREVYQRGSATVIEILKGVAHHHDDDGDWLTEDDVWLTGGEDTGVTFTIRRTAKPLPTERGAVIVPAEGHEYITATFDGETYRAREAVLVGEGAWHASWRTDASMRIYAAPAQIDPSTWKVDDQ